MREFAFDWSRRAVVFGGAAFAGPSATGCCAIPETPEFVGACRPQPSPFLAGPEVLAAWAKPECYFDAHTHFFNAQDVPVASFLAKSVAHSIPSQKLRELVQALAPVAEALAQLAPPLSPNMTAFAVAEVRRHCPCGKTTSWITTSTSFGIPPPMRSIGRFFDGVTRFPGSSIRPSAPPSREARVPFETKPQCSAATLSWRLSVTGVRCETPPQTNRGSSVPPN